MFAQDLTLILQWWAAWWFMGIVGFGYCKRFFSQWPDQGYLLSRAFGLGITTLAVWLLGTIRLVPFNLYTTLGVASVIGILGYFRNTKLSVTWRKLILCEVFFGLALFSWAWVKGHEPSINGLEKFMDYGFTKSILSSQYFPPADMWYTGKPINYYYFGHMMMAITTRVSGVDLAYGFNLMLASTFALTVSMVASIALRLFRNLRADKKWAGVILTVFLVALSGNLQTIYAFTSGYSGDTPPPFWEIWKPSSIAWNSYWYPNATRFIPYTIHEFPSYSFVVSDMHGHVLDIPLVLFVIALLIQMFALEKTSRELFGIFGMTAGMMFMTNALDGLIYLGLFGMLYAYKNWGQWFESKKIPEHLTNMALVLGAFGLAVMPFVLKFEPFVSGLAVNCPPAFLANQKIGPILFETVDKCQRSPLWMMLLLWGFFVYNAVTLCMQKPNPKSQVPNVFKIISLFCLGLIIFPEFFYFKDIYPMHFRSNTMFKLGYQVFILMSLISGYVIMTTKNRWYKFGLIPLIFLISIYPYFAVRSYFGGLKTYQGLYGLEWFETRHPEDFEIVKLIGKKYTPGNMPIILEASGDSYTEANRISAFSGTPTVAGWLVHEWLWRGYDVIAQRTAEVREVYETQDVEVARATLKKYQVDLVVVGEEERLRYPNLSETKFGKLGRVIFELGETRVYEVI